MMQAINSGNKDKSSSRVYQPVPVAGLERWFPGVLTLVILSVVSLWGCREKEAKAYSGYHIDQNKMVGILTDIVLAEGNDRVLKKYGYNAPVIIDSSYQFIYKKYDLEKWQMDSSFKYYANRPDEFSAMMDKVLENLNRLEN